MRPLSFALAALLAASASFTAAQDNPASPGATAPSRAAGLPDFTALVKKQGPTVVNVITTRAAAQGGQGALSPDDPFYEFFRRFMPESPEGGPPGQGEGPGGQGVGSGFIISADGYILTNAHVVAGSSEVTVRMADAKREFKAKVVGADERTDIALLKVEQKNLPVARLGKSSTLEPGQWVAAIGSPFGFANTITAGIVSATQRALPAETYLPFIQTDVAVNPGNSGGPLLNLDGEVVGINSMIYSRTGGYMGVSFAIPIEEAIEVSKQLREHGKVTRGRLGIGIQPVTKELAQSFKLDSTDGVVVVQVEPGSPAEKAGLQVGDVILTYNGKKIVEGNMLPRLVGATKPGQQAKLEVLRKGERRTLGATIGEMPSSSERTAAAKPPAQGTPSRLGLALRELQPEERKKLGVEYGVVVVDIAQGPAARTPIRRGDVIVAVNQARFKSIEEFTKLIEAQQKGDTVALLVRRGEGAIYVPIEVG
ncbi:MAG TPA: DegQ family serine endoprotease [Burkholderiales bacterium]